MPRARNLAGFVIFSSALSVVVGGMGLAGCFLHLLILRTIVPGGVAIAANTALCLVFLGLSLYCLQKEDQLLAKPWRKWGGWSAAAAVGLVGFVSLTEHLGNLDFAIDQLFFSDPALFGHVRPGLMSPITALNLVLLGTALLLLDWKTRRHTWPAQILALISGLIALFTILDMVVAPHPFHTHPALPTAIVLGLFPFAIIAARPRRALGGLLVESASRSTLLRRFLSPAALLGGPRGGPLHYILAVLLAALATLLRHWLVGHISPGVMFITFVPAVMTAALVGGFGPGVLATVLSAACVDYYFFPPTPSFAIATRAQLLELLMFLAIGVGLSWLASALEQTREEASAKLRQNENELRQAQKLAHIGSWKWDRASGATTWSDEMYEIFQRNRQLPPPSFDQHFQYTSAESAALEHAAVQQALQTGQAYEFDLPVVLPDGARKWVINRGTPDRDSEGRITGLHGTLQDITERKRAETALRESEERYRSVVSAMVEAVLLQDKDGKIIACNQSAERILGLPWAGLQELTSRNFAALQEDGSPFPVETYPPMVTLRTGQPQSNVCMGLRQPGRNITWLLMNSAPLFHEGEATPYAVITTFADITARKQAEAAISAERQKFNTILDSVPPYVILLTPDYHVAFANREFRTRFGEHQGRKCYEVLFQRSQPCEVCETFQVLTDDRPRRWQWKGPHGRHYDVFAFPFLDTDGSKLILEMGIDITQQHQTQAALDAERKRFQALLDGLPAMICLLTPSYEVAFANQSFRKTFGEAQGRKCYQYCYGKTAPCEFCQSFQVLQTGMAHDWEISTNGRRLHVFDVPFCDVDGSPLILEMDIDVTEARQAEEELARSAAELKQAQRVARLGSWRLDVSTGKVTWTEELYRMLGLDPSQPAVSYQDQARLFTPQSWARLTTGLENTVQTGVPYELELETVLPGGVHGWMLARGEAVRDHDEVRQLRGIALDITERKQAELALRESERQFSTLADLVPQFVWICTADGRSVYFNRRWFAYTGLSKEESYGRGWNTPFHPDDKQTAWDAWNHALATGEAYQVESRLRAADGSYRWFLTRGVPLRDAAGNIEEWFGTCTDIDDMKQAAEILQTSETKHRSFIAQNAAGFIRTHKRGTILDCNDAMAHMLGHGSGEELLGTSMCDLYFDLQDREPLHRRLREQKVLRNQEICLKKKDGSPVWALLNLSLVEYRDESDYVLQGTFIDITETRKAHEQIRALNETLEHRVIERTNELRQATQRFQTIVDHAPIAIYVKDREGRFVFGNRQMERYTGASRERLLGMTDYDFASKEDADQWRANDLQVLEGQRAEFEEHGTDAAGHPYVNMSIKFPLTDESGKAVEICGISSDITRRKRDEEALRASEELLRAVTDNSPDAIYVKDTMSRWLMANPAVLRIVGRSAEQALGKTDLDLYADPALAQAIIENDRRILESGRTESFEEVADTPDGRRTFLSVKAPRRDAQGNIVGIIGISRDITQRKRAEEALRESESRLAAANKELETFNYTVAHDLRAPLRHIHGFAEMLAQEAEPVLNENTQRYLQVIRESIERMGLLLQELLNLSRLGRQEIRKQPCDLHHLVQQILTELKPDILDRAIEWRIADLPTLECDPTLVRQVLANLMGNAVKFTRKRSPAVIEIGQTLHRGVPAILVRDNGEGFDMKYADKLFGVFQRLHRKEDFEGTGVGLAIVQRIVHKHGGTVWAEAEPGRGATFYFTLQSGLEIQQSSSEAKQREEV